MHIIVFIAIDVPGGGNVDNSEIATIEDLLRRYCYVVDDAQWDALSEVFTAEVRFVNEFSGTDIQGIERVTNWYRTGKHPAAHLLANVLIAPSDDGQASARSKYLTVQHAGLVGTGEYHDQIVRTSHGWRVRERVVVVKSTPNYHPDADA